MFLSFDFDYKTLLALKSTLTPCMTSHPKFDFANVVDFERINATNDITQSNTNVTSFVDVNRNALMLLIQKFDCERIIHFLDEVTLYSLKGCVHGQLG